MFANLLMPKGLNYVQKFCKTRLFHVEFLVKFQWFTVSFFPPWNQSDGLVTTNPLSLHSSGSGGYP